MRSDVHFAALRAAAKVAFSVAFIGGCAAEATEAGGATNPDGTPASTSAEADLSAKKTQKKKPAAASDVPADCHHADASVPKLSCDQLISAAFPTEGGYPGTKQDVSAEVQTCCADALEKNHGATAHRWDCCANLPPDDGDGGSTIGIACTPWGPPVPPSMKRRARRAPSLAIVQAVA